MGCGPAASPCDLNFHWPQPQFEVKLERAADRVDMVDTARTLV
jgi:hypothetical protein